jgi:hypothetical protein
MRDMTERQFLQALERHGMKRTGFMGYVEIGIEGRRISVCRFNAGKNLRAQLAYLLAQKAKYEAEEEQRLSALRISGGTALA